MSQKFHRNCSISHGFQDTGVFVFCNFCFAIFAKSGGKTVFGKVASRLWTYPVGQIFRRNRSISLRFRDKRVFAFYTEIQDGHQKWRENDF